MACHETLAALIGERLAALGRTVAVAESCSGGLIADRITDVPGASGYFLGGVVAYSNGAKVACLGVSAAVLEAHGAVSGPVARELAEGARTRFGADYAVSATGIAGPSGGTAEKPVGLVFLAVARAGETRVDRHVFSGSRERVKAQTAEAALQMLWDWLE